MKSFTPSLRIFCVLLLLSPVYIHLDNAAAQTGLAPAIGRSAVAGSGEPDEQLGEPHFTPLLDSVSSGSAARPKDAVPLPVRRAAAQAHLDVRGEGETCEDAIIIPALPYEDAGNTCGFANDYDEVCPYPGSTAPDVIYSFTPDLDYNVTVSLCNDGTDYDTKLYIYEGECPGTLVACNEDRCNTPQHPSAYVSRLSNIDLLAGRTYFFVVDGYGAACGNYVITVDGVAQCAICPPDAMIEGEPVCSDNYEDYFNGGCNYDPETFQPIECGQTVCGESGWYISHGEHYRDTDWYVVIVTEATDLTWEIQARFKARGFIIDGTNGCDEMRILATGKAPYCQTARMSAFVDPGTYWLWAGPDTYEPGEVCGSPYVAKLTCNPESTCAADFEVTAPGVWTGSTTYAGSQCSLVPSEDHIYEVTLPRRSDWRLTLTCDFPSYLLVGTECCSVDIDYGYTEVVLDNRVGTIWVTVAAQSTTQSGAYTLEIVDLNGDLECPPEGVPEGETDCYDEYDDQFNVGCEVDPPLFSEIECGQTVCGTYGTFVLDGYQTRDTDWYQIVLDEPTILRWTLIGEAPTAGYIIQPGPNGCDDYEVLDYNYRDAFEEFTLQAYVFPGTYWLWAGTRYFTGTPCGANYIAHVECEPWICEPQVVSAPGSWSGNTCEGSNQCFQWVSNDAMYEVELPYVSNWRFTLSGSTFKTRLFVGTTCCGAELGENVNYRNGWSQLEFHDLGGTVYVTIEGFETYGCGTYYLTVSELPEMIDCPAGANYEEEPECEPGYDDHHNGGCDIPVPVYQSIECGEIMCGTSGVFPFGSYTYRDTDWFEVELTETSTLTWEVYAQFPPLLYVINATAGCAELDFKAGGWGDSYQWQSVTAHCLPAGVYWLYLSPAYFDNVPCGFEWVGSVTCEPCAGACCLSGALPCEDLSENECLAADGSYLGPNTACDYLDDCNANGVPDICDSALCDGSAWCSDCNGNGRLDYCDVPEPRGNCLGDCSDDCQEDGIPDDCQFYPEGPVTLWDNGPFITHLGQGCNGEDVSALQTELGLSGYGVGVQSWVDNRASDDFVLSTACMLQTATLYAYQSGSTPPAINNAYIRIWDGPPDDGGSVVFGDLNDDRLIEAQATHVWRAADYSMGGCTRGINAVIVDLGDVVLPAGTYWLEFTLNGDSEYGPWAIPVTILGQTGKPDANAMAYSGSSDTWAPIIDAGVAQAPQDLPFLLTGLPLPPTNDCNDNGILDECDIADGNSLDANGNGVPDECELIGDIDGDGDVDLSDLAALLASYGKLVGEPGYNPGADFDHDGDVDLSDLAALLAHYTG